MEKEQRLTLRVEETFPKEQGRPFARICLSFLKDWGIKVGDVVELQSCGAGGRKIGAITIPSKRNDQGVTIVRVNRNIRKNLRVALGELVTIRRIDRQTANQIRVAPAEAKLRLVVRSEALKTLLLNRPVLQGEILTIRGKVRKIPPKGSQNLMGITDRLGMVKIRVKSTDPPGIVVVDADTEIVVQKRFHQSSQREQQGQPPPHGHSRAVEYN